MSQFAISAYQQFWRKQRRPVPGNPASDRILHGPGCHRHNTVCVTPGGKPKSRLSVSSEDALFGLLILACVFSGRAESVNAFTRELRNRCTAQVF